MFNKVVLFQDNQKSEFDGLFGDKEWFQTEIKPRFCKTSENYFFGFYPKVRVKLPLKIEIWGSAYAGSRSYDESKIEIQKSKGRRFNVDNLIKINFPYHQ